MTLKDAVFLSPAENILYDDVLLDLAEHADTGECLRLWESRQVFVVLGRISKIKDDLKLDAIGADHIPVLRRSSGGGTVLQGPGCLNFTFVLSKDRHVNMQSLHKSYQYILGFVMKALESLKIRAEFMPISDLACEGKKFSGNAQKRGKKFILHHGTILYHFDTNLVERYLKIPRTAPQYRHGRGHFDFINNIDVTYKDFKQSLIDVLSVKKLDMSVTAPEEQRLNEFLRERNPVVD